MKVQASEAVRERRRGRHQLGVDKLAGMLKYIHIYTMLGVGK